MCFSHAAESNMNDEPAHARGIPIDFKAALILGKSEPMSWITFAFNAGLVLLVVPGAIEIGGSATFRHSKLGASCRTRARVCLLRWRACHSLG
jgi:hypothetical protein